MRYNMYVDEPDGHNVCALSIEGVDTLMRYADLVTEYGYKVSHDHWPEYAG